MIDYDLYTPLTRKMLENGQSNIVQIYGVTQWTRTNELVMFPSGLHAYTIDKPIKWRTNGKLKTCKRNSEQFQQSIKHGLSDYYYITENNIHLFAVLIS